MCLTECEVPLKKNQISIAVLLASYNGGRYLPEQLDSILCQSHKNFTIYIFDDCSDNNPMDSLEKRYTSNPRIKILVRKKRLGYAKNFLYGLREVQSNYDYYAFCDQDDIWNPDKLEIAITALQNFGNIDKPSLYFSRTEAVREDGKSHVTLSQNYKRPPSFANALVQNMGGGNTMVFNSEARTLINKHSLNMDIISHDWMMYLFVSAVGGGLYFDQRPTLKYRQHENNEVGANNAGPTAILRRALKVRQGRYRIWITSNLAALDTLRDQITEENKVILETFQKARTSKHLYRVYYLIKSGVYRQPKIQNAF